MSEPVIHTEELTRTFGEFRAVDGISFSVGAGEVFGFLGAKRGRKDHGHENAYRSFTPHKR